MSVKGVCVWIEGRGGRLTVLTRPSSWVSRHGANKLLSILFSLFQQKQQTGGAQTLAKSHRRRLGSPTNIFLLNFVAVCLLVTWQPVIGEVANFCSELKHYVKNNINPTMSRTRNVIIKFIRLVADCV